MTRPVGQTADGSFQVGASRTFPIGAGKLWRFITRSPFFFARVVGLNEDTHETSDLDLEKWNDICRTAKSDFSSGNFSAGEITTWKAGSHLRIKLTVSSSDRPTILQIRVVALDENKSRLSFHQENMPDAKTRQQMKQHWKKILAGLNPDSPAPPRSRTKSGKI